MGILDERELTDAERAAMADEPRPGVWLEEHVILTADQNNGSPVVDRRGDGRRLDQAQTDSAIAAALFRNADRVESNDVLGVVVASLSGGTKIDGKQHATDQRGGIHSDPLVRLLAFRAWGERDRAWRKRDTALAAFQPRLGAVIIREQERGIEIARKVYGFDGISMWTPSNKHYVSADRGGRTASTEITKRTLDIDEHFGHILDAFDEIDAKLDAGGDPPAPGPHFEITASR